MAAKSSESQNYGLLISAVVAIVAIVGQVILFNSGGSTGMLVEMSGPVPPYAYAGIGQAEARGYRTVRVDTSVCASGNAYFDFNDNFAGCYDSVSGFGSGVSGADTNRYSGEQQYPHAYRAEEGGMYSDGGEGADSFNRGAYGKGERQGIDRTTLPARDGLELG